MKIVLLINGPNLNLLGQREPEIYGPATLTEIESMVAEKAAGRGIQIKSFQSNHEGAIIDFIQAEQATASGVIINPGALAHYGYALRDSLAGVRLPIIEVHISNVHRREEWRRQTIMAEICTGIICGLGPEGYLLALDYLADH